MQGADTWARAAKMYYQKMIKGIHQYVNGFSCDQKSVGQNPKGKGFLFLKEEGGIKKWILRACF